MGSNVNDDIKDFEVCGIIETTKIEISWEQNSFFLKVKKSFILKLSAQIWQKGPKKRSFWLKTSSRKYLLLKY